jgi:hypothetical protein
LSSDGARLFYTWLLSHLDKNGTYYGASNILKGHVVPLLRHISESEIDKFLVELEQKRLIRRFKHDGKAYINYPDFDKQPNIDTREATKFPLIKAKKLKRAHNVIAGKPSGVPRNSEETSGNSELNIIQYNINIIKGEGRESERPPFNSFINFMKDSYKKSSSGKISVAELVVGQFEEKDLKRIYEQQKDYRVIGRAWLFYIGPWTDRSDTLPSVKAFVKDFNTITQKMGGA